jgi:hypothetical protein
MDLGGSGRHLDLFLKIEPAAKTAIGLKRSASELEPGNGR